MVGDVFENDRQGFFDCPSQQRLKSGSDEGQGAGGVRIADQTCVLPPLGITLPVARFAAPMRANDVRQTLPARFAFSQAADEMPNELFVLLAWVGFGFSTGPVGRLGLLGFCRVLRCVGLGLGRLRAGFLDRRLIGGLSPRSDQAAGFGEITRRGIGNDGTELPEILASMPALG